jgi:hypothetical protein
VEASSRLLSSRVTSRRKFLAGLGGIGAALALGPSVAKAGIVADAPFAPYRRPMPQMPHLAWVWRFDADGDRRQIRSTLLQHGMGILFKTHDGTNWMPDVGGKKNGSPEQVGQMARYFERAGVPFHAWCNVLGEDPVKEARMAASVLAAGARSLTLDLEGGPGFWVGSKKDAVTFNKELRRWQPDAWIMAAPDARPWEIDTIPIDEFAPYMDGFAPQTYWSFFNGPANRRLYKEHFRDPGQAISPGYVVEAAIERLGRYDLPIYPIGDGTTSNSGEWREFIVESQARNAPALSVWRYGVTDQRVWGWLQDSPPAWQRQGGGSSGGAGLGGWRKGIR